MTTAGKRLLASANEALAFAKGEADPSTYIVHAPPETVDVKAIRTSMNMTQKVFGVRFGFGAARIRDWEQGRTRPAASDRVLLVTIRSSPETVLGALAACGETKPIAASLPRRPRLLDKPARAKPARRASNRKQQLAVT